MCSWRSLGRRKKIDEIPVRVTKVNRTSAPWLSCRRLDPCFHQALQPPVLLIEVGDPEFQDHTPVSSYFGRPWYVLFLGVRRENRQHPYVRRKLSVIFTRFVCLEFQDAFVEFHEPFDVLSDQARIDEFWGVANIWRTIRNQVNICRRSTGAFAGALVILRSAKWAMVPCPTQSAIAPLETGCLRSLTISVGRSVALNVESRHLSYYLHLEFCPIPRAEVDIRLIFARSYTAEFIPREAGNRDVLGRMVPLQLILRSSILGSNVKALEMRRILHTERNPPETAQLRIRRGIARQDHFNRAVLERCSTHDGQSVAIFGVLWSRVRDTHGCMSSDR